MNQLALIEKMAPTEIYSANTIDSILIKIKEEVAEIQPDLTTVKGRKEIASLAYKVTQSKTFMDNCGKKLGEEHKKALDAINSERKKVRDTLEDLAEQVRKPLTEWELKEENRIKEHRRLLVEMPAIAGSVGLDWQIMDTAKMDEYLDQIQKIGSRDWEEFANEAAVVLNSALDKIETSITRRKEYDAQQTELIRLREEKAKRDHEQLIKEQEEKIKKENAVRIAREKAEAENRAKREAELKAEQERILAAREKQLAEEKIKAIEKEKREAELRAKEAAERAERDKKQAVENERSRIEKEKLEALAAEEKRQANVKHRTKINNAVLEALKLQGVTEEVGKKVITAIVSGVVPYTKINY